MVKERRNPADTPQPSNQVNSASNEINYSQVKVTCQLTRCGEKSASVRYSRQKRVRVT